MVHCWLVSIYHACTCRGLGAHITCTVALAMHMKVVSHVLKVRVAATHVWKRQPSSCENNGST